MSQHIYIYSPSGAVRDTAAFKRGVKRLRELGHEVEVDEAALKSYRRFAGDDACRVAAIHRAADSGADVALIARGGYGLTRILPSLDYRKIAKAIELGMNFVGMSDFTAFQNAVLAQTASVTWAGPALCEGFGAQPAPDEIMEACFNDLLLRQGEGAGWKQLRTGTSFDSKTIAVSACVTGDGASFVAENCVLWGGNLSVLCGLLGTPYFPQIEGGILFLEDVAEHPYRIERMLTQLLYAGVLARQKVVLMGQFTDYKLTPHDRGFKLSSVFDWLSNQIIAPVVSNLPYGHVPTKVLLPVGAHVDFSLQGRDALIFWG
jgi:muramoyltetrapeptide carboxypeptidase